MATDIAALPLPLQLLLLTASVPWGRRIRMSLTSRTTTVYTASVQIALPKDGATCAVATSRVSAFHSPAENIPRVFFFRMSSGNADVHQLGVAHTEKE
jgi:hypothetical protein